MTIFVFLFSKFGLIICVKQSTTIVLYQLTVMILIYVTFEKNFTIPLICMTSIHRLRSSLQWLFKFLYLWCHLKPLILMTSFQTLYLYDVIKKQKKHPHELYVYNEVYLIRLFWISHTVSTLNQYHPSIRALRII